MCGLSAAPDLTISFLRACVFAETIGMNKAPTGPLSLSSTCETNRPMFVSDVEEKIRDSLGQVKPGTTICPGRLARKVGTTLPELRPWLEALEQRGEIAFYQKGQPVRTGEFKGPFRVSPRPGRRNLT